jgi:tripartite-type tricarboxylate transporter receptor subunit TctC
MHPTSRLARFLAGCAAAASLMAATPGQAQNYPSRPVRLVVGFTPGGGVDINARLLAGKLSEIIGQQVVVENKPGAGTNIANEFVARAAPDGYTLLINTAAVAINMSLYRQVPFDTLKDFAAVSVFSESQNLMVTSAAKPYRTVADVIAAAKAKPGALTYSSAGSGSTQNLAGELFKLKTKSDLLHVPYKGSAPSTTALIAGEVDLTFINIPAVLQHVRSGRLRALAATGTKRTELLPEVPTLKEAGVEGAEGTVWYGVLAPAATPREIVATLSSAIAKAAHSPDVRQRLLDQGAEPVGSSAAEFTALLREEVAKWRDVVRAAGLKAE